MRHFRLLFALIGLVLIGVNPALAQTFPKFTGLVVDDANVLPPEVKADLTTKLEALQKDTNRQFVVATIGDMQGYPLDDYGYKLGRAWGVGLKDANNGIILFVAPNNPVGQRGPRIEVGYGLEPIITDALSSVIINQDMLPRLKQQDIPGAVTAGADAIIAQLRASPEEAQAKVNAAIAEFDKSHKRAAQGGGGGIPFTLIFWGMIILFIVLSGLRRGKGKKYRGQSGSAPVILWGPGFGGGSDSGSSWSSGGSWGGGSSDSDGGWGGGGFSGGGGGSFGGGGASGDW